jgi:hypothetical protein
MQVLTERVFLETDQTGHLTQLPKLPSNARVEAIFIILDQDLNFKPRRRPHAEIIGKTRIQGEIFTSASESDWDLPE